MASTAGMSNRIRDRWGGTAGPSGTLGQRPLSLQAHSPRGPQGREVQPSRRSSPGCWTPADPALEEAAAGVLLTAHARASEGSAGSAPSHGFKGCICGLSLNACPIQTLCPLWAGAPCPSLADSQDTEPAGPLPWPAWEGPWGRGHMPGREGSRAA